MISLKLHVQISFPERKRDAREFRKLTRRAKVIRPRPLLAGLSCGKCNESLMALLGPREAWLVKETSRVKTLVREYTLETQKLHFHVRQPMHFNKHQQLNIYRGFIVRNAAFDCKPTQGYVSREVVAYLWRIYSPSSEFSRAIRHSPIAFPHQMLLHHRGALRHGSPK